MVVDGMGCFDEEAVVARQCQELSIQMEPVFTKHFPTRQSSREARLIQDMLNKAGVSRHIMISLLGRILWHLTSPITCGQVARPLPE